MKLVTKRVGCRHENRHQDQWNRLENTEMNPNIHGQLIFDRGTQKTQGERIVPSTDGAGETGYPLAKK